MWIPGAEWVHGDLGCCTGADLVVCISHSGNTKELVHALGHITTRDHPPAVGEHHTCFGSVPVLQFWRTFGTPQSALSRLIAKCGCCSASIVGAKDGQGALGPSAVAPRGSKLEGFSDVTLSYPVLVSIALTHIALTHS